ncbi:MAG: Mpo1-like protein [Owenweeksia sp.]
MDTQREYTSLKDFYPYYLTEHRDFTCRVLHFIGTGLVLLSFITFWITLNWVFLAIIPFLGYGFAWVGHFFFEQNKPATFKYPGYSLASDFILFWHLLTGKEKFKVS